ncbi:MAG: hypothetical protein MJZ37_07405 [Bacilli bacterium]|nr:hypothetical protein [Bacilli bacterium]
MDQEILKQKEKALEIIKEKKNVRKQILKYVEVLSNKDANYVSELECLGDFVCKARLLEENDCTFVKNTRMLFDIANGYLFTGCNGDACTQKQEFLNLKNDLLKDIYADIELLAVIKKIERFYEK